MRVLVCGGRDYADRERIRAVLKCFGLGRDDYLIHGGAPGADSIAAEEAAMLGCILLPFPAAWHQHGRSAGPRRNQLMLDSGRPDFVIAFPGHEGTEDMRKRAARAGLVTYIVPP